MFIALSFPRNTKKLAEAKLKIRCKEPFKVTNFQRCQNVCTTWAQRCYNVTSERCHNILNSCRRNIHFQCTYSVDKINCPTFWQRCCDHLACAVSVQTYLNYPSFEVKNLLTFYKEKRFKNVSCNAIFSRCVKNFCSFANILSVIFLL